MFVLVFVVTTAALVALQFNKSPTRTPDSQQFAREAVTPIAVVESTHVDLGVVKPGYEITNCISIRNDGDVVLRVRTAGPGCGGAPRVDNESFTIAAHSRADISLTIGQLALAGEHDSQIKLYFDDPKNPFQRIKLRYTVN